MKKSGVTEMFDSPSATGVNCLFLYISCVYDGCWSTTHFPFRPSFGSRWVGVSDTKINTSCDKSPMFRKVNVFFFFPDKR